MILSLISAFTPRRPFGAEFSELPLPPHLPNDLGHEIAQYAGAATRSAARRCLQRAMAG